MVDMKSIEGIRMGCMNQFRFIQQSTDLIKGPVLEVGSKDYGSTPNLRPLLPGCEYLGVDQEEGKGVDVVLDLTSDLDTIARRLPVAKFNTIICFSVLEHCRAPFTMCDNLSELLNRGGLVFVSVPFSWQIHAFPSDYWRFTPQGVRALFPGFDFDTHPGHLSTNIDGDTESINDSMMYVELSVKKALKRGSCGPLSALGIRMAKRLGILPQVFRYPHLFPPVMVNMIGVKRA
jgi:hypothetical protein